MKKNVIRVVLLGLLAIASVVGQQDIPLAGYPNNLRAMSVTIASGASVSQMVATQGEALVGIIMPSAWTAADIGYKSCITGRAADLQQVYDSGGNPEKTVVVASHNIAIPQADTVFAPFIQILSVSTADDTTGVTQGADRTVVLLFRKYLN